MSGVARRGPPALYALIRANATLWAGEAEVFATYFGSPARTAATDAAWLARQCFKEIVDGVVGRIGVVTGTAGSFDDTQTVADAALRDEGVRAEAKHYVAFAIAHAVCVREMAVRDLPEGPRLGDDWPENRALQAMRARHRREFGALGERAAAFTEGGYGTLYHAGMALAGGCARDAAIAAACAQVYDDEWAHMLEGIAGLADVSMAARDWDVLHELTVAQSRARIRMRNAQFGRPLPEARIAALEAGTATPLEFDYARACLTPP
jgi:hypothetical protein